MRSAVACDVAVIGAGLAGLWAARSLAQRGLRVALVEAERAVDARVRTTGIFVRRTLEDFEMPAGTLGEPIRRVVLYSPKRRALELTSNRDEFRVADMRALSRALLRDCLRSGVMWLPGARYGGLCAAGCCVCLELGTRRLDVAARFIVGADGARSRVAADLGLSRNTRFIVGTEDVYQGCATSAPALHCFLDPDNAPGYIAWVAHDGALAHVGVGGNPARFNAQTALLRFTRLLSGFLDVAGAERIERRAGLIPVNGVLERIACARGLLVGDAAGAVSPLTAGGLDACLRLSEFAAHAAACALSGHPGALAPYRGSSFEGRIATRRWMRAAFDAAGPPALELACTILRFPLARFLAERFFFGQGSFPNAPASDAAVAGGAWQPAHAVGALNTTH